MVETILMSAAVALVVASPVAWFVAVRVVTREATNYRPLPAPVKHVAAPAVVVPVVSEPVEPVERKPTRRLKAWTPMKNELQGDSE